MVIRLSEYFLIFLFMFSIVYTQPKTKERNSNQNELTKLKKEIAKIDKKINDLNYQQRKEIKLLDSYDEQEKLLGDLIKILDYEESSIENQIELKSIEIKKLRVELDRLKEDYSKSIRGIYIHRQKSDFEMILSSGSLNQALLRIKYLKLFTDDRKKRAVDLVQKAELLRIGQKLLAEQLAKKEDIKANKISESAYLNKKIQEKQKLIDELKKDESLLFSDLERKKKSAEKIQSIITELIKKDNVEKEKRAKRIREKISKAESKKNEKTVKKGIVNSKKEEEFNYSESELFPELPHFLSFSASKGKLPWPVTRGKITGKFGEQKNEQLNTVTLNFGVDIQTPSGSIVKAVADGIVSAISWLPGFGNVIIVRHSEGYRTVYGNLSNVYISEDQLLKAGETLGISGSSLSGESVHFEIWKEKDKQNPEIWLARK